ncbi:MAG: sugar kinase [Myxococcales bacterium]|nr:sugar kinase [Myxococcales bacterium]
MSLLVVGSVALDSVETPSGKRDEILGGSAVYFSTAASFTGENLRLVAVIGEDFPKAHVAELEGRGICCEGLQQVPGRTFRWAGRYDDLNEAVTLDTQLNVFEHFKPEFPPGYAQSRDVLLANIDPVLQGQVLDQIEEPRFVAMDTMNFWIEDIIPGKRQALLDVVSRVDMLFVNDTEAKLLSGEETVLASARKLIAMGPSAVVIKRGEYGALLFTSEGPFFCPAYPVETVVDPTGAGDSFAGGFMGHLSTCEEISEDALRTAAVVGSATASFVVEGFSIERMRTIDASHIQARVADFRRMARIPDA